MQGAILLLSQSADTIINYTYTKLTIYIGCDNTYTKLTINLICWCSLAITPVLCKCTSCSREGMAKWSITDVHWVDSVRVDLVGRHQGVVTHAELQWGWEGTRVGEDGNVKGRRVLIVIMGMIHIFDKENESLTMTTYIEWEWDRGLCMWHTVT